MVFLGIVMMPFYYGSKVRSVPEWLRRRYNRPTHLFNAVSFAVATVLIGGVNLFALGLVLSLMLGWSISTGILVAAAVVLVYITLGGLNSAIYNEVAAVLRDPRGARAAHDRGAGRRRRVLGLGGPRPRERPR
jgi:solute:Na+ symporter, SSS family